MLSNFLSIVPLVALAIMVMFAVGLIIMCIHPDRRPIISIAFDGIIHYPIWTKGLPSGYPMMANKKITSVDWLYQYIDSTEHGFQSQYRIFVHSTKPADKIVRWFEINGVDRYYFDNRIIRIRKTVHPKAFIILDPRCYEFQVSGMLPTERCLKEFSMRYADLLQYIDSKKNPSPRREKEICADDTQVVLPVFESREEN